MGNPIKETLQEQLKLLSERSKMEDITIQEVCLLSETMARIADALDRC